MTTTVWLNNTAIEALDFQQELISGSGKEQLRKIKFNFKVTSAEYHDIAVLLYEMDFRIKVPEKELDFEASITNYSTSVTNLYKENQVADYYLELTEKG